MRVLSPPAKTRPLRGDLLVDVISSFSMSFTKIRIVEKEIGGRKQEIGNRKYFSLCLFLTGNCFMHIPLPPISYFLPPFLTFAIYIPKNIIL